MKCSRILSFAWCMCVWAQSPAITTAQYDNARTNANLNESILNTSNVRTATFGKVGTLAVDGQVFTQPLYLPGLMVAGKPTNALFVATMRNNVYAFDADNLNRPALWQMNLGPPVPSGYAGKCPATFATGAELGILSTPVIDRATGTLYVVSATPQPPAGFVHRLFALDVATGALKFNSPVQISLSVPGTGADASAGVVTMNNYNHIQRPGLLLANGSVYAAFGSCGPDPLPFHGWVVGYNAATLVQTAVMNTTPDGNQGAIWQSGRGLVSTADGSIFAATGNGSNNGVRNLSDSILKLTSLLTLANWYIPPNEPSLDSLDLDLSGSGPLFIPSLNLLVAGGKEGVVYVLNPASVGKIGAPVQTFQGSTVCNPMVFSGCQHIRAIAAWDSPPTPRLYIWGVGDNLRSFRWSDGRFVTPPESQNALVVTSRGTPPGLALSALGGNPGTGIVWATTPPGRLHAFNAENVSEELWNSEQNAGRRDILGSITKTLSPTVVNGRVFVPTPSNGIVVYGLLGDFGLAVDPPSQTTLQGSSAKYTVTVTPSNGFIGNVSLSVAGLPAGATAAFSPESLPGSGSSTLTVTTTNTTGSGTSPLTITGTSGSLAHTASSTLTVTAPADFSLTSAPASQSVVRGTAATYTVTVGALNGFTGNVALAVAGLPSGATASFSPASLPGLGSSTLTVSTSSTTALATSALTITGTSGSLAHTASSTLTVTAPADFSLTSAPASQSVVRGTAATYTVTVGALNGFTGNVALAVAGLPAGATASFSPASLPGLGSSTLTVSTSSTTALATSALTITGTSGSLAHTASSTLTVTAPANFSLTSAPASQSVVRGAAAKYTVTVGAQNGFTGNVALAVAGLPAGATASFSPASLSGAGTSTLTVTTSTATALATSTLTITGTSGTLTRTASSTLTVVPPPDFSLAATPSWQFAFGGSTARYTVTVRPINGFTGNVALTVAGLPTGATASFSPASLPGSGTSTLTVTMNSSTAAGWSTLTITGASGAISRRTSATLIVLRRF